jgi:hypothetical protein
VNRIAMRSGVSHTTIRNCQNRKTHRPNAATLRFVPQALGYDLTITQQRKP